MTIPSDITWVHYLPAATTAIAAAFSFTLLRKYRVRPTPHIGWWAAGVATYGTGTLLETIITLAGNTVVIRDYDPNRTVPALEPQLARVAERTASPS